jgi:uncharacterized Zn-binding protein involved in type VI secretion
MMPAAARSSGADQVYSLSGSGHNCDSPLYTTTGVPTVSNVLINGIPPVVLGDLVGVHPFHGCGPDTSVLTTGSSKVFINGKGAGRLGDYYTSDNIITTGSPNVFIS